MRGLFLQISSYRLQFGAHFGLTDAANVLPYLAELGITETYFSRFAAPR